MQDKNSFTIGVLSITATVLLVGVILTTLGGQNTVQAIGQTDRGGDYILVTGQFTNSNELIYITDAAAKRLYVYGYDWNRRSLVLWDWHDLKRTFENARGRGRR